jgi:hypothetical protein
MENTGSTRTDGVGACSKPVCPALGFDIRYDTSRTLVSDEMADILARLSGKHELLVDKGEVQVQLFQVLDRLCKTLHSEVRLSERLLARPSIRREFLVDNRREKLDNPFLEHIKRLSA